MRLIARREASRGQQRRPLRGGANSGGWLIRLWVLAASVSFLHSTGGVLENVKKVQVDPTVIERPELVQDPAAANLVRYDLRAALRDAFIEDGESPVRAHIVLDEFRSEGAAKRLAAVGSGRNTRTVGASLLIQDASGKELANVPIHLRGSVAFDSRQDADARGRQPSSDFERRLLQEIERLK